MSTPNTLQRSIEAQTMGCLSSHDHYVAKLPDLPAEYTSPMYAGFVPISSSQPHSSLFYWLFTSEKGEDSASTPLVIWLNGGPGRN